MNTMNTKKAQQHTPGPNARLLEAAPELLAALRECITDEYATCYTTLHVSRSTALRRRLDAINNIARAAIDKATGN